MGDSGVSVCKRLYAVFLWSAPEYWLGSANYLLLYFGALLSCSATTCVLHRHQVGYASVGASGAIVGVVFGFCPFRPFEMLYFFGMVPIPALLFAALFVAGSVAAIRNGWLPGMAHDGHLGGALGEVLLTIILEPTVISHFLNQLGV